MVGVHSSTSHWWKITLLSWNLSCLFLIITQFAHRMWHASVYRARRKLEQTLRDGAACQQPAWCVLAILDILEETVLLKRCVCICQEGRTSALARLLISIYLSCWCPFTELHAWWFQQSKVITTSPASAVMPNGPGACQQDHSYPCHFLSVGAAVNLEQLGYFRAGLSSCVPSSVSCRAAVIFMDVTHCRRTRPCSPWPGSPLEGAQCQGQIIWNPS